VDSSFRILSALGGVNGDFDSVMLPNLPYGLGWELEYEPTSVGLNVITSFIAGDYNHDGTVNAADYVVYRNSQGQSGPGLAADGDGDHQIDTDDYGVWRVHFGQSAIGSTAHSATVPEPATVSVAALIIAVICALFRFRPDSRSC
jgi:hypothetical protein